MNVSKHKWFHLRATFALENSSTWWNLCGKVLHLDGVILTLPDTFKKNKIREQQKWLCKYLALERIVWTHAML